MPDDYSPNVPKDGSDVTGELALFSESGVPSIMEEASTVFAYVEGKAQSIGLRIPKNRGRPPNTPPENMLSLEEKAIAILGNGVGLTPREVFVRINRLRHEKGEVLLSCAPYSITEHVRRRHREIVTAIQADMLSSVEAFAPLVSGQARFAWRAKVLELYRQWFIGTVESGLSTDQKIKRITKLDKAMGPHMTYFDNLGMDGGIGRALESPRQALEAENAIKAELAIQKAFEDGEITDSERISRLQRLKHGEG
jgi:hypothetical protein